MKASELANELQTRLSSIHSELVVTNPLGAEYVRKIMEDAWSVTNRIEYVEKIMEEEND